MASVESHVRLTAAIVAGGDPAMDRAAAKLQTNLVAEAARHNLTSAFMNSFETATVPGESGPGQQVSDRVVYTTDPGAMAINYGRKYTDKDTGEVTRVPGKHVFERAIGRTSG